MNLELPQEPKGTSDSTPMEQIVGRRWHFLPLWTQALSSIVGGVAGGYAVAEKVANPWVRWTVEAALLLFSMAASYRQWEKSRETSLYVDERNRFTKAGNFPSLAFLAIAILCALAVDLVSTFNGAFNPLAVSQPAVNHVGFDVCVSEKDANELSSLRSINLDIAADRHQPKNELLPDQPSGLSVIDYRIGKKDNFREAWITDVEILVDEFREFPRMEPTYVPCTTTTPFQEKTIIVTELSKKTGDNLPWSFKPSYVLVNGTREAWERGRFRFSDSYCELFGFHFLAKGKENAGLYSVRIRARTATGVGGESEMELPGKPIWLGFFALPSAPLMIPENEKFVVSRLWEVSPKPKTALTPAPSGATLPDVLPVPWRVSPKAKKPLSSAPSADAPPTAPPAAPLLPLPH